VFDDNDDDDDDDDEDDDDDNNKSVETSREGKVSIRCNQPVQTDRTVPNFKPDTIIRDNEKETRMSINVAFQESEM
jgi:hypothetical protein